MRCSGPSGTFPTRANIGPMLLTNGPSIIYRPTLVRFPRTMQALFRIQYVSNRAGLNLQINQIGDLKLLIMLTYRLYEHFRVKNI